MSKFELWLLQHLIRKMLILRCTQRLLDILWTEARTQFYEDNVPTRFEYFADKLRLCALEEIQENKRQS